MTTILENLYLEFPQVEQPLGYGFRGMQPIENPGPVDSTFHLPATASILAVRTNSEGHPYLRVSFEGNSSRETSARTFRTQWVDQDRQEVEGQKYVGCFNLGDRCFEVFEVL